MVARINRFERADESEGAINYYDMPGMLLDTTSKVVRQQSCYEVIKTHKRSSKGDAFKKACLKDLVGSTILTQYNKENYRIDDIDFENSPLSKFDKRGVETSYSAVKSLCPAPKLDMFKMIFGQKLKIILKNSKKHTKLRLSDTIFLTRCTSSTTKRSTTSRSRTQISRCSFADQKRSRQANKETSV